MFSFASKKTADDLPKDQAARARVKANTKKIAAKEKAEEKEEKRGRPRKAPQPAKRETGDEKPIQHYLTDDDRIVTERETVTQESRRKISHGVRAFSRSRQTLGGHVFSTHAAPAEPMDMAELAEKRRAATERQNRGMDFLLGVLTRPFRKR